MVGSGLVKIHSTQALGSLIFAVTASDSVCALSEKKQNMDASYADANKLDTKQLKNKALTFESTPSLKGTIFKLRKVSRSINILII